MLSNLTRVPGPSLKLEPRTATRVPPEVGPLIGITSRIIGTVEAAERLVEIEEEKNLAASLDRQVVFGVATLYCCEHNI
jgi:hypothetical protein